MVGIEITLEIQPSDQPAQQLPSLAALQEEVWELLSVCVDWFMVSEGHASASQMHTIQRSNAPGQLRFTVPHARGRDLHQVATLHWLRAALACEAHELDRRLRRRGWALAQQLPSLAEILEEGEQLGPFQEHDGALRLGSAGCACHFCSVIGWRAPLADQLQALLQGGGTAAGSAALYARHVAAPTPELISALVQAADGDRQLLSPLSRALIALAPRANAWGVERLQHSAASGPPGPRAVALLALLALSGQHPAPGAAHATAPSPHPSEPRRPPAHQVLAQALEQLQRTTVPADVVAALARVAGAGLGQEAELARRAVGILASRIEP